jgi:glutathione synthase/RimK-type ligase-like ATP-grasp enzyme
LHRIALVTYSGLPFLSADDRLVLAPLAQLGIRAEAVAWDDAGAAWDSYDALILRSTWNYHLAPDAFLGWVGRVESLGVPVWNPPPILRWNSVKTYLRDLESRGVEIVPTRWAAGVAPTLAEMLADASWSDAVVKPAISASAYETWRVEAGRLTAADEARFRTLAARPGGAMVQRFLPELARDGEWSLMFLDRESSHAVLKRPRSGDFRVQHEHGGSAEPRTPPPRAVEGAAAVLATVPGPLLYARVDGVEVDGRFVLVELELLEPSLFLGADERAPERFAKAICSTLDSSARRA